MAIHKDDNDWQYYQSLDEARDDGFTVMPVWSTMQFFTLEGRRTQITTANLTPLKDVSYVILGDANRYYKREYKCYSLNELYFYRKSLTFSGEDVAIENLRRYIVDGRVWLLFTAEQTTAMKEMLERVKKGNLSENITTSELKYRTFIKIMEANIDLEDYKTYSASLTGYKTVCNQFDMKIQNLWKSTFKN